MSSFEEYEAFNVSFTYNFDKINIKVAKWAQWT